MGKKRFRGSKKQAVIQKIKEGQFIFAIIKTPNGISCPCNKFPLNRHHGFQKGDLCKHVLKILKEKGVSGEILKLYEIFKQVICANLNNHNLRKILDEKYEEIMKHECAFCHEELYKDFKNEGWHICHNCKNLLHAKCFLRWDVKNKGCMFCRDVFIDPIFQTDSQQEVIQK